MVCLVGGGGGGGGSIVIFKGVPGQYGTNPRLVFSRVGSRFVFVNKSYTIRIQLILIVCCNVSFQNNSNTT